MTNVKAQFPNCNENSDVENEKKYVENGIAQLKLKKYQDAFDTFRKMSQDYPNNWKSWVGISIAENGMSQKEFLSVITDKTYDIVPQQIKELIGDGKVFWRTGFMLKSIAKICDLKDEISKRESQINECYLMIQQNDKNLIHQKELQTELKNDIENNNVFLNDSSEMRKAEERLQTVKTNIGILTMRNEVTQEVVDKVKADIEIIRKQIDDISKHDDYITVLEENVTREA